MRRLSRCWQWIQVALLASQLPLVFPLAAQAAGAGLIDHQHHEELDDFSAPPPPPVSELVQSGLDKARSGDHLAAIKDYNRAIQKDSRDAHAYAFRSQSLRALGDDRGAQADVERVLQLRLKDWDQLLALNPDDADAYAGRAATRLSLGDASGAIDDYTTLLQLRAGAPPAPV
jgi:tetratricopeptide (TPR) repeat protein